MVAKRIEQLSPRERECLRLVALAYSSKQIGRQLGISHHTVDDHLKHAMSVLDMPSRFEAARLLVDAEGLPPQALGTHSPSLAEAVPAGPSLAPERSKAVSLVGLPIRNGRRGNDLTAAQRLLWIAIGAVGFIFALSQLANGLKAILSVKDGIGL